jgi:hypothetical protein
MALAGGRLQSSSNYPKKAVLGKKGKENGRVVGAARGRASPAHLMLVGYFIEQRSGSNKVVPI